MELRTLRYFVEVASCESVSAAAVTIRISQPALSRQIRELEREIGLQLFDRHQGRLRLSAAGRHFLPMARDLLARADAVSDAAADLVAGRLRTITIGAPVTTLDDVVAPFIASFRDTDPLPSVRTVDGLRALEALYEGADLVIVTRPPGSAWSRTRLVDFPIYAFVRSTHPWAHRDRVRLEELPEVDILALATGRRPRQILDTALADAGLSISPKVESDNAQTVLALAAAGRGVAVASDDSRFDLHRVPIVTTQISQELGCQAAAVCERCDQAVASS